MILPDSGQWKRTSVKRPHKKKCRCKIVSDWTISIQHPSSVGKKVIGNFQPMNVNFPGAKHFQAFEREAALIKFPTHGKACEAQQTKASF